MSTISKKRNHLKKITVTMHTENKESNSTGQSQGWIGGYMKTRSNATQHSKKNKAQILNELKESDDYDDYDDDDDENGDLPVQIEGSDIQSNDDNQSSYQNKNGDVLYNSRKNSEQLNEGKEKTNGFYAEEQNNDEMHFTSNESLISNVENPLKRENADTEPDDLSKTKNGEKRPYICSLCPRTYTSSSNLKRHMRVHTGETTGTHRNRHKCHLCQKEYVKTATLRNHFRKKHADSNEKPFKCPACEESFFSLNACNGHLQKHKNYKPFKCSKCEKGFCREMNLKMHILNAHADVKPFTCESCGRSFLHQPQFIQHARSNCLKTFVCDICNKVLTTKQNLILHKMTHTDERNLLCKFCDKRFLAFYALKRHMRIHTGEKPFTCDHCPMRFIRKREFRKHMTIHTGVKLYLCETCGKEFNCDSYLTTHKRLHTGERPYVCQTCGKRFVQTSHLRRHTMIHTGIKPYKCVDCGKSFNQRGILKTHEKTHSDTYIMKQKRRPKS